MLFFKISLQFIDQLLTLAPSISFFIFPTFAACNAYMAVEAISARNLIQYC